MNPDNRPDAFLDAMARLNRDLNRRESPPSVQEGCPSIPDHVADTARALAGKWERTSDAALASSHPEERDGHADGLAAERAAIESAARACGPQVLAAFQALVTGDAHREVGP